MQEKSSELRRKFNELERKGDKDVKKLTSGREKADELLRAAGFVLEKWRLRMRLEGLPWKNIRGADGSDEFDRLVIETMRKHI